ncbi:MULTISPECIES: DUF2249 domain-containing protein [Amycolatopsis]|uniref:DUF2249 domain-containing protein n=2 Tax=Amycolatopsis TaxID=1813 RepID=A0A5C4M061_9PSEU|nr:MULTISPECIES: DUF2249 domain-containing protein [Amycolatopsis]PKV99897.1 uncharacterized protein (DUF2249 family) [Amycolatopsis niigatensis]TNC23796.1 DUF2249 domain-containing protein [Amycolatopsis alkalitolerans]
MTTTSGLYITGTTTDPAVRASAAIRDAADRLLLTYQAKAALVTDLCLDGMIREQTYTALVDFAIGQVRPYLAATDRVLYAAAAGAGETRLLVRALRRFRESITEHLDELAAANSPDQASHAAQALGAVLRAVLDLDQTMLLPALAELPGADLPGLADDLRTLLDGGELDAPDVIDVRPIPHGQRHPRVFGRYSRLAPGDSFVLVNNHDPKPLRREFTATYPGAFTWDYLESGPAQWRVRIGRPAMSA